MNTVWANENGQIFLKDILKNTGVNPKDVCYYSIENGKEGSLKLSLFDANQNPINVKEKQLVNSSYTQDMFGP